MFGTTHYEGRSVPQPPPVPSPWNDYVFRLIHTYATDQLSSSLYTTVSSQINGDSATAATPQSINDWHIKNEGVLQFRVLAQFALWGVLRPKGFCNFEFGQL